MRMIWDGRQGVNRGIAEAHRNGIVTSTSLLANGSAFDDGVQTARCNCHAWALASI